MERRQTSSHRRSMSSGNTQRAQQSRSPKPKPTTTRGSLLINADQVNRFLRNIPAEFGGSYTAWGKYLETATKDVSRLSSPFHTFNPKTLQFKCLSIQEANLWTPDDDCDDLDPATEEANPKTSEKLSLFQRIISPITSNIGKLLLGDDQPNQDQVLFPIPDTRLESVVNEVAPFNKETCEFRLNRSFDSLRRDRLTSLTISVKPTEKTGREVQKWSIATNLVYFKSISDSCRSIKVTRTYEDWQKVAITVIQTKDILFPVPLADEDSDLVTQSFVICELLRECLEKEHIIGSRFFQLFVGLTWEIFPQQPPTVDEGDSRKEWLKKFATTYSQKEDIRKLPITAHTTSTPSIGPENFFRLITHIEMAGETLNKYFQENYCGSKRSEHVKEQNSWLLFQAEKRLSITAHKLSKAIVFQKMCSLVESERHQVWNQIKRGEKLVEVINERIPRLTKLSIREFQD